MLKRILCVTATCLILCIAGCRKYNVELGNNYTWKLLSYRSGESVIVNSKDQVIIGSGGIDLWAKYPWIYGSLSNNTGLSYWAINIETQQVITRMNLAQFDNFISKNSISNDLRLLATWGDVTVRTGNMNNTRILELQKAIIPK